MDCPAGSRNNLEESSKRSERQNNSFFTLSSTRTIVPFLLCPHCLPCLSSVVRRKKQLERMELDVRKLQRKILQLLRSLQLEISSFQEEIQAVERIAADSKEKVGNLDKFFGLQEEDDGDDVASTMIKSINLKDAIQFREKILTVIGELQIFKREATLSSTVPAGSSVDFLPPMTSTKHDSVQDLKTLSDNKRDDSEGNLTLPEPSYGLDKSNHNATPEDSLESSAEDNDVNECSSGNEDDAISDDDDGEWTPKTKTTCHSTSATDNPDLVGIDFTGMASFKTHIITGVINLNRYKSSLQNPKRVNPKKTPKKSEFDDIDPQKTHFLSYDAPTGTINLADIQFTFNEQEKVIQCSKCTMAFRETKSKYSLSVLYRTLQDHVMSHHLKLFCCPHCPRSCVSFHGFKTHVLGHRTVLFPCDICGKPLRHASSLRSHRWLHMNEEKKSDAIIKEGLEGNPLEKRKERLQTLDEKYQCSTCGKGFIQQSKLKKHEEAVHAEGLSHLCPTCGKGYKNKAGLFQHQKYSYSCSSEKSTGGGALQSPHRFKCPHCPKMFPVLSRARKHAVAVHAEVLDAYKCSICGKGFKGKAHLAIHEQTHSDARPSSCKWGCGANYKAKTHCRRHEKSCRATKNFIVNHQ